MRLKVRLGCANKNGRSVQILSSTLFLWSFLLLINATLMASTSCIPLLSFMFVLRVLSSNFGHPDVTVLVGYKKNQATTTSNFG